MAVFNPQTNAMNPPDFTGVSAGPTVNRSFEALFSGIGDLIGGAVKGTDQIIQNKIEKDARYGFDSTNDEFNLSSDTVPPELTRTQEGLQTLAMAHMQGKVTPEYYYQRLASQLKALRAKYPGYEREVDRIVQEVTGERPANAYRDALMQNIQQTQNSISQQNSKYESWLKQGDNIGYIGMLFPDFDWSNPQSGKYTPEQVMASVARVKGQEQQFQFEKSQIAGNKQRADLAINERGNQIVSSILSGQSNVLGFGTESFMQTLKQLSSGGKGLTPEDIGAMTQLLDQAYIQAQAEYDKSMSDPSFQKLYTPQELSERRLKALEPIRQLRDMIQQGQWSQAAIIAGRNQLTQDKALASLYKNDPNLGTISAMSKLSPQLGDFMGQQIMMSAGGPVEYTRKIAIADQMAEVISGSDRVDNVFQRVYNNPNSTAKDKNAQLRDMTKLLATTITSGKTTPDELKSMVKNYEFLDEMFSALDPSVPSGDSSQHLKLFSQLFNPEVTQKVVALGDRATLNTYFNSARNKFVGIPEFRTAAADLAKVTDTKAARLVYNPETNRVDIEVNEDAGLDLGFASRLIRNDSLSSLLKARDKFNQAMTIMAPIVENMGGNETDTVMMLANDLARGVDGNKQYGLWTKFAQFLDETSTALSQGASGASQVEQNRVGGDSATDGNWKVLDPQGGEQINQGDVSFRGQSTIEGMSQYAPDGTAATEAMFAGVLGGGRGYTDVQLPDGTSVRRTGPRNWRNNNPGNIEYGNFAIQNGAIGTDGRFAIFPDYATGRRAKENLLFNSRGYRDLSLEDAIDRYAPPTENDTSAYVNSVASAIGVDPTTPLASLDATQRAAMLDAMQRVEGWSVGSQSPL